MTQELLNIRKIVEDEMRRITREMVTEDVAATAQRCLICGAFVPATESYYPTPKVCDKCKAAVLKVRKEIEGLKEEPTIEAESLRPHWLGEQGASRDDPPGPDIFEKTYERGGRGMIYKCEDCKSREKCFENKAEYTALAKVIKAVLKLDREPEFHSWFSFTMKCDYFLEDRAIVAESGCCDTNCSAPMNLEET